MKKLLLKSILLLCALVVGTSAWAADAVTIASFTMSSHTGWTIEAEGNAATNPSYYLLTASDKYIESPTITFSSYTNIKIVIKARKYGGPSNDQKVVSIYQGATSNVLGSYAGPSGTSLVNSSAISISPSDGKIKVACLGAGSSKGCGVSEITITGEEVTTDEDSEAAFANTTPSFDLKDAASYTQTATTATGYTGAVTYSITSNTAGASINATTGEVTPTRAGSVTVKASAAKVDGAWTASSATYTLTVNDTRASAGLAWSASSINIPENALESEYTLPTLTNPHSLAITYTITGTDGLATESAGVITVDTSVKGTATVKASFDGNSRVYKSASVSYTITVYDPSVKGTIANPYSVADIITLNPTSTSSAAETGVYVVGYILGSCVGSGDDAGDLLDTDVNTNMVLADDPAETDKDNYISVQLPSGTIRTALNVLSHPYYKRCVKVLLKGDVYKYCGIPGIKSPSSATIAGQAIKVTAAGLSTYCTDVNLKFDGTLEAYIAKEEGGDIKLYQVTNVPANTPVLLRAPGIAADTYFDVVTTESADDVEDNIFKQGADAAVATGTGPYNWILSKKGEVIGFYHANGNTVASNRAYLQTTTASARILLDFDNVDVTAIENVEVQKVDGQYFNLAGQRVANPTKGLYIVNGKKVVIK